MKVSSHNDWDPLKEIIVGRADNTRFPTSDSSVKNFIYASGDIDEMRKFEGPLPSWVIEQANEDIEEFVKALESRGVKVYRPEDINLSAEISTPEWTTTGWSTWCPRDMLLPLDNLVIEAPSPMRSRYYETKAYHNIMLEAVRDGVEWVSAPKPLLNEKSFTFEDLSKPTLTEFEPIFDAPNVLRLGKDILYQVSNSGNLMGYKWLKNILEPRGYRLHLMEDIYRYAHIDSTILPLRPGLVLLNSARVNDKNCPEIFKTWDKIYFDDIKIDNEQQAPEEIIPGPSSPYIALNVLSIDPKTVCIDKNQTELIKRIEAYDIECVPLPMRHSRTLNGGFHCATLDLVREGSLQDYS